LLQDRLSNTWKLGSQMQNLVGKVAEIREKKMKEKDKKKTY
jgi:hypothetical protein